MYLTAYNFSCYGYFSTRTRTCQQKFFHSTRSVGDDVRTVPAIRVIFKGGRIDCIQALGEYFGQFAGPGAAMMPRRDPLWGGVRPAAVRSMTAKPFATAAGRTVSADNSSLAACGYPSYHDYARFGAWYALTMRTGLVLFVTSLRRPVSLVRG